MSRPHDSDDLPLFDLPLHAEPADSAHGVSAQSTGDPAGPEQGELTFPEVELPEEDDGFDTVGVLDRLLGGLIDLGLHVVVLLVVGAGSWLLGAALRTEDWPAYAVFLLLFSLLYTAIPLAFWGQTPGMMRVGHVARTGEGEPLTFGQTALRWIGALVTVALAGLPLLLALGAQSRSLADRMSGSYTDLA